MNQMDMASIALLAVAGYVAVLGLVRLMTARRDSFLQRFRRDVEREKQRRQEAKPRETVQPAPRQRSA